MPPFPRLGPLPPPGITPLSASTTLSMAIALAATGDALACRPVAALVGEGSPPMGLGIPVAQRREGLVPGHVAARVILFQPQLGAQRLQAPPAEPGMLPSPAAVPAAEPSPTPLQVPRPRLRVLPVPPARVLTVPFAVNLTVVLVDGGLPAGDTTALRLVPFPALALSPVLSLALFLSRLCHRRRPPGWLYNTISACRGYPVWADGQTLLSSVGEGT
jgi:hypothetical protein